MAQLAPLQEQTTWVGEVRGKGLMTELRMQDLHFSNDESLKFLHKSTGQQIEKSVAEDLVQKTEGWVSGLILAVISLRNHGRLDPALLEPQVNAQYVMEYLFTEVFARQPSEIIRYMMSSAILDRFCGPWGTLRYIPPRFRAPGV